MKCSKCDFFKSEIHYLGHLISAHGISPLPDKLDTIKDMPTPKDVQEIKQFLGLTGYYRKFVPRFSDISRLNTTQKERDEICVDPGMPEIFQATEVIPVW